MGKINESLFLIKEQLKEERDERNLKIKELQKHTDYELESQRKFNEGTFCLMFRISQQDLQRVQGQSGRPAERDVSQVQFQGLNYKLALKNCQNASGHPQTPQLIHISFCSSLIFSIHYILIRIIYT